MNPEDFFKTCELLLNHNEEPHLRTVVGRSYYAPFLYFREYLKQRGLSKTIKPNRDAHVFVQICLQFSQVTTANIAATHLNDLRQRRLEADYDLESKLTQADAQDALELGRNVLETFSQNITPDDAEELIKNGKAYAQSTGWTK